MKVLAVIPSICKKPFLTKKYKSNRLRWYKEKKIRKRIKKYSIVR
jgi:hypothetical protein